MPNVTALPRTLENGRTLTQFTDTTSTSAVTYTYPTQQTGIQIENSGEKDITVTVGSYTQTVKADTKWKIDVSFTSFSISSVVNSQEFIATAFLDAIADTQSADSVSLIKYAQNIGRDSYWNTDPTTNGVNGAWSDRQTLLIGDSHGWGEGSPNYQGATTGYTVHSPWIHNKGFYGRLMDYMYQKMDSEPWRVIPLFNKTSPLSKSTAPNTLYYGDSKMTSIEDKETFTLSPQIKQGRYYINTVVDSDLTTQGQHDYLKTFCNAEARLDTYAQTEYKYNADIGLLGKGMLNLIPDINRTNNDYVQVEANPSFSSAGTTLLANNCGGTSASGTAFLQVLTVPSWLNAGDNVYIPELGTVNVSTLLAVSGQTGRSLIYIKNVDTTNISFSTLQSAVTPNTRVYVALDGKSCVLFPMKKPSRYAILHLTSGVTNGGLCKIELLDDSIKNNDGLENWRQAPSGFGNPIYGTKAPKVYLSSTDNTAPLSVVATNATINTNSIVIDTSTSGYNFETFYVIDFGQKKKGTIRLSHAGNGASYTAAIAPFDTSNISTRGVLVGNRDLVRNCSFGGHTTGAWLGLEASYSSETRNHIADINAYKTGAIKSIILEAPIVNEWLKQTPIATFKTNLTQIKTNLACNTVFIFTTLGLRDREYGTDEGVVKFEDYAQAVKDWATSQGGEVSFIDCRKYLKNLVSSGIIADYNDLWINNGHPSPMSNELMFEMLKKVVDMKF